MVDAFHERAKDSNYEGHSTGGFVVRLFDDDDIELVFEVYSWDTFRE